MTALFPNFLRQLALLRWIAVIGQTIAVTIAVWGMALPLDAGRLWAGVGVLGLFNLWAWHRSRRGGVTRWSEALAHIAADTTQLAWMIAWSGGAMNPFTSLFLLPVALVAVTFPVRAVIATAALCGAGYAASAVFGHALPHVHGMFGTPLDLHLWGMAINFVICCLVFAFFVARLAGALRAREADVARLREQFARNEGIVALATHAASVAHELNTPLGTLTLLVEEQLAQTAADETERRDDLRSMAMIVNDCRDRVRELAAPARGGERADVSTAVDRAIERWQLLRPTVLLDRHGTLDAQAGTALDPGIGHLLQALLNNAADASEAAGSRAVSLSLDTRGETLFGWVRDHGAGFDSEHPLSLGALFQSTKRDGLGIGLALSHATIDRLGGELSLRAADGGGTQVDFEVPLRRVTVLP